MINEVHFKTNDGYQLAGTLFEPADSNVKAIIFNSATGVLRVYYRGYAKFLAAQGFSVLTYDYRGIGGSRLDASLSADLRMLHWGTQDMDAAITWMQDWCSDCILLGIGHSIGGQLLGIVPNSNRFEAFLNIASQQIHWTNYPLKQRFVAGLFFHALLPVFAHAFGGLPSWVLGAEHLPKKVALDWSAWGRKRDYICDEQGKSLTHQFARYNGKMRLYSISDDVMFAPPQAVLKLQELYENSEADIVTIRPEDYGMKKIDHFGFFKSSMNKKAWSESSQWLLDVETSRDEQKNNDTPEVTYD
jgi:predicted alpha/beta hydrolase